MSRVLTIEDDEITANDIAAELRKRGFSVDWVNNGREGMARAMGDENDIITLDRMLPGVDGLTIVTRGVESAMYPFSEMCALMRFPEVWEFDRAHAE